MLGVTPETISNWADQRKVNHLRTPGGHRRFFVTDLLEFRRNLTIKATDEARAQ